jgi:hypothetical protein
MEGTGGRGRSVCSRNALGLDWFDVDEGFHVGIRRGPRRRPGRVSRREDQGGFHAERTRESFTQRYAERTAEIRREGNAEAAAIKIYFAILNYSIFNIDL